LEDNTDFLAYQPIEIILRAKPPTFIYAIMFIGVGILILVFIFALVFYRKFIHSKARLDYEVNDVRNTSNIDNKDIISKTGYELTEIKNKLNIESEMKYSNLTEEVSSEIKL